MPAAIAAIVIAFVVLEDAVDHTTWRPALGTRRNGHGERILPMRQAEIYWAQMTHSGGMSSSTGLRLGGVSSGTEGQHQRRPPSLGSLWGARGLGVGSALTPEPLVPAGVNRNAKGTADHEETSNGRSGVPASVDTAAKGQPLVLPPCCHEAARRRQWNRLLESPSGKSWAEAERKSPIAWEDTVNVPALGSVRIAWMPDDRPGGWMYCHILEHHAAGMMAHFAVIR